MSTYTPIASQTLGSATSSITFSSIPQGYTDLVLVIAGNNSSSTYSPYIQFNGDTGTNYSITNLYGTGSAAASTRSSSTATAYFGSLGATQGNAIVQIQNYSNSTTNKTALIRINDAGFRVYASVMLWRSTAAITSLTVFNESPGTFASGSTFSLYGIAGGGYTAKAAGGVVTTGGGYAYHTFTTSGAFTPYENLSVDYLVVAGGGGATTGSAGGGGAGGYRTSIGGSQLSVKSGTTYPAIVGAGGAGTNNLFHTSGSNSVFATITSTGGGKGGVANTLNPDTGGSGGGGAYYQGIPLGYQGAAGNTPATSPSQGNKGGDGRSGSDPSNPYAPGGGGGAGAAGADATSSGAGAGGIGVSNSISGTATYYAGGGGGGADAQRLPNGNGAGGLGGGGAGGTGSVGPSSGTINTGGGGGGGAGGGQTGGSGGAASVTLPATGTIPATYTDLYVVFSARSNRSADTDPINLELNGSTTNDSSRYLYGDGSSAASGSSSTQTEIARVPAANATSSTFGSGSIYIPNYTASNAKSSSGDSVTENNGTTAFATLSAGLWNDTSAITSIRVISQTSSNFVEGSTFYLYGISNVTSGSKATGGIVSSDGTYWYHMFPYSGTFTPTTNLTADYLVIAGGGGGNYGQGTNAKAGGGGAGGLRSTVTATGGGGSLESALSLTANTAYTVTVGAGGAGGVHTVNNAGSGSNSVFSTITSTGGGRGAGYQESNATGGSGGGGAGGVATQNGAAGTTNQGYAGGNALGYSNDTNGGGGGGGGAGAVGGTASSTATAGAGGAGVAIPTFANATQTGVGTYYAGGGGGAAVTYNGAGGLGGGGAGGYGNSSSTMNGIAGAINTGSGGGGGSAGSNSAPGGAGGSGLVIIRYAI